MNASPRATAAFMLSSPAHLVAMGFGTGLSPFAPGTVGTLLGFPLYWLLAQWLSPLGVVAVAVPLFALGAWACQRTGLALGVADHGSMVWDEVVAFVVVLAFTPHTLGWQLAAFFLFRFFDVVKPPPARYVDRTMKNGFGVMLDDLFAGIYTLFVLAIGVRLLGA
jgi:phosphatidylglycerophosphatase A